MEAKFTKGAWKKVRNIEDNKIRGIDGPQNECIIRWGGIARPESEEGQANATLMIASPLLYDVAVALDKWSRTANPMRLMQELDPIIEQCRHALRAARGE